MARVDLHVHSTASDGRVPPAEVAQHAHEAGLAAIALTDHDTVQGVAPARSAGEPLGLRVVSGCEFSVRASFGEMHLLGYFLPDDDPGLAGFLETQRAQRAGRMARILARLRDLGIDVSESDLDNDAGGALGRPHAARALVARGAVADLDEAFRRYLGTGRPAYVAKTLPELDEVTRLVRDLGGVSSAAHLKDRAGPSVLTRLKELGVDAVEARHPSHDDATAGRIEKLTKDLNLLVTGGSDWHGEEMEVINGRRAPLGSMEVPAEWLDAVEQLHNIRTRAGAAPR